VVNRAALLSFAVVLAAAGCGGGGGEEPSASGAGVVSAGTYEGDGFSFSYPGYAWVELESRLPEPAVTPEVALGLPQPNENIPSLNLMNVTVGQAPQPITKEDIPDAMPTFRAFIRQLAEREGGRVVVKPAETTLDGLPGFDAEISGSVSGNPVRIRTTFAWEGRTQYQVNCQYTLSHAEEMLSGCDQVLESFQVSRA
jgi:hypothetical protein